MSIEVDISLFDDASGTGFVVDKHGHIVTNAHVVEDAFRITVVFQDGAKATAVLVGTDTLLDVAALKVNTVASRLKPVTFGDSDDLAIGQSVLAIGNPFGLEASLTTGIISGLKRELEFDDGSILQGMIQTDAAIAPGSSGGPLMSLSGEVIGVNSAGVGTLFGGTNFGFAIPSNTVKRISDRMIARSLFPTPSLTPTATDTEVPTATAPSQPTLIVTRLSLPTLTILPTMSDDEVAQLLATPPP
ncbi:MAG: trypsin-like peptidase domain-containing protein, partial [Chloroflexota bacterium]|nr:trypsin-like peptidase domain-containing protein [Chloroflexota bacterium]MDE2948433.1 trypsin-like peptidase domain-containing protein [Chloroflexota bacterium]